jgi:hypothetical protein
MLSRLTDRYHQNKQKCLGFLVKCETKFERWRLFSGLLGTGGGCTPKTWQIQAPHKFIYTLKSTFVVGLEPHPTALTVFCVRTLAIVAVLHGAGHSCGYLGVSRTSEDLHANLGFQVYVD